MICRSSLYVLDTGKSRTQSVIPMLTFILAKQKSQILKGSSSSVLPFPVCDFWIPVKKDFSIFVHIDGLRILSAE